MSLPLSPFPEPRSSHSLSFFFSFSVSLLLSLSLHFSVCFSLFPCLIHTESFCLYLSLPFSDFVSHPSLLTFSPLYPFQYFLFRVEITTYFILSLLSTPPPLSLSLSLSLSISFFLCSQPPPSLSLSLSLSLSFSLSV